MGSWADQRSKQLHKTWNHNHCGEMSQTCRQALYRQWCLYQCDPYLDPWIQNWTKPDSGNSDDCDFDLPDANFTVKEQKRKFIPSFRIPMIMTSISPTVTSARFSNLLKRIRIEFSMFHFALTTVTDGKF